MIIKETNLYKITKIGNIYKLTYFDECKSHPTYNKYKKITQSRVTKNKEFISRYL